MSSGNASKIDILVEAWGYNDLLNEPTFEELPYYIHVFVGIFITVLCKKIIKPRPEGSRESKLTFLLSFEEN